jgi:hypothetical protein
LVEGGLGLDLTKAGLWLLLGLLHGIFVRWLLLLLLGESGGTLDHHLGLLLDLLDPTAWGILMLLIRVSALT